MKTNEIANGQKERIDQAGAARGIAIARNPFEWVSICAGFGEIKIDIDIIEGDGPQAWGFYFQKGGHIKKPGANEDERERKDSP